MVRDIHCRQLMSLRSNYFSKSQHWCQIHEMTEPLSNILACLQVSRRINSSDQNRVVVILSCLFIWMNTSHEPQHLYSRCIGWHARHLIFNRFMQRPTLETAVFTPKVITKIFIVASYCLFGGTIVQKSTLQRISDIMTIGLWHFCLHVSSVSNAMLWARANLRPHLQYNCILNQV